MLISAQHDREMKCIISLSIFIILTQRQFVHAILSQFKEKNYAGNNTNASVQSKNNVKKPERERENLWRQAKQV